MKAIIVGLIACFTAGVFTTADVIDSITGHLKNGDSAALSGYFMASIDLTVLDDDGVYSKAQAEQMVRKFFTENVPSDFEVVHKKDQYCIGNLSTNKGSYRVTFFLKDEGGTTLISQFMIEEDD